MVTVLLEDERRLQPGLDTSTSKAMGAEGALTGQPQGRDDGGDGGMVPPTWGIRAMTSSERRVQLRTTAVAAVSVIAAVTAWGAVTPATAGYITMSEAMDSGPGPFIVPVLVIVAACFGGVAIWTACIERRPFWRRAESAGPAGPIEPGDKVLSFLANAAGLVAAALSWRVLSYASATTYVGTDAGDFFRLFIPADIARGMVLGAAAYAIASVLVVAAATEFRQPSLEQAGAHHS